jgi:hypothetical protein
MPQALYLLQRSQAKYLKHRQGALKDAEPGAAWTRGSHVFVKRRPSRVTSTVLWEADPCGRTEAFPACTWVWDHKGTGPAVSLAVKVTLPS